MNKIKRYNLINEKMFNSGDPEIVISRELIIQMYNDLMESDREHTEDFKIKGFVYYAKLIK